MSCVSPPFEVTVPPKVTVVDVGVVEVGNVTVGIEVQGAVVAVTTGESLFPAEFILFTTYAYVLPQVNPVCECTEVTPAIFVEGEQPGDKVLSHHDSM